MEKVVNKQEPMDNISREKETKVMLELSSAVSETENVCGGSSVGGTQQGP